MTITTKYMPATDKRGSRLQAKFGSSVLTTPYPHELDTFEAHKQVAMRVSGITDLELVREHYRGYEFRQTDRVKVLGFKNHETAQVILQISNERTLYDRAVEWARGSHSPALAYVSLVEHLTKSNWKTGLAKKVPGTNLTWGSPLLHRGEILEHVRDLIQD